MRQLLLAPLLLCSSLAFAQAVPAPSNSLRLARLILSQSEEGVPATPCVPSQAEYDTGLQRDIGRNVSSYGGITPQSVYWNDVVVLNYELRKATCLLLGDVTRHYAAILEKNLKPAELADTLAFMRTAAGRKFLTSMPAEDVRRFGEARMRNNTEAHAAYQAGMQELAARYKADPR